MGKIRVLIVDDSVVIRRIISDLLSSDPALEVVGIAANGRIALERIPQVNPDVVTLDVEMPEMDGLQTLSAIRRAYPCLPVIMFSALTERAAAVTLDALALGASDYVTKPANVGSAAAGLTRIREELIPKIKGLCGCGQIVESNLTQPQLGPQRRRRVLRRVSRPAKPVGIVAIGASTGGPNALGELIPIFPVHFPVPIVIVQHMPPLFTKLLAERLASRAAIEVKEGLSNGELKAGTAWVAPGDYHMVIENCTGNFRLKLNQEPPENSCRPAVDALFRSVAETYGDSALAVVLTGMGQDGLRGCEHISEAGGQIIVQDEASSVVWGMPGFVARAGLADQIVPLNQLGAEIIRMVCDGGKAVGATRPGVQRVDLES